MMILSSPLKVGTARGHLRALHPVFVVFVSFSLKPICNTLWKLRRSMFSAPFPSLPSVQKSVSIRAIRVKGLPFKVSQGQSRLFKPPLSHSRARCPANSRTIKRNQAVSSRIKQNQAFFRKKRIVYFAPKLGRRRVGPTTDLAPRLRATYAYFRPLPPPPHPSRDGVGQWRLLLTILSTMVLEQTSPAKSRPNGRVN
jgi:hypothetical protein